MPDDSTNRFTEQIHEAIRQALKNWHNNGEVDEIFNQLYLYRQLQRRLSGSAKLALNQLLLDGIALVEGKHDQAAQFLRDRFLDGRPMSWITNKTNLAESTLYALQRQATEQLADSLLAAEREAVTSQKARLSARLAGKMPFAPVGIEARVNELQTLVLNTGPPWVIVLEGIGGIGKTTLATTLLHRLVDEGRVDEIGWVGAQTDQLNRIGNIVTNHEPVLSSTQFIEQLVSQLIPSAKGQSGERLLSALQSRLKEVPHVIVIDNLETVVDVESLLPVVQSLANPSKFLVTSRENFYGAPYLHHLPVEELTEPDALHLIRQEADLSGLPVLAGSSDTELRPIYETVGGNPLALRLVVGQTHVYPLQTILYDLQQARSSSAENLYTFIYQKAWEKLDVLGRQALLVMPLASPAGDELTYLAEVGDLDPDEFRLAMNQLVTLNLVDARGGLNARRYSIHALTRTFLEKQVAKWL